MCCRSCCAEYCVYTVGYLEHSVCTDNHRTAGCRIVSVIGCRASEVERFSNRSME